jgi:2-oxoglutarate ferredoxin oxidoreductase subunit gamma
MRKEIRISGFGGQGVILAGYILGRALCLYEGYEVVMTQSYGPEARGGASSANLVVARDPIAYPFVQRPDYLLILSQEAFSKFGAQAGSSAAIIIDEDLVEAPFNEQILRVPATRLAEALGRRIVANVVMLGFAAAATGLAGREAMTRAVEASVAPAVVELNLRALEQGWSWALERAPVAADAEVRRPLSPDEEP